MKQDLTKKYKELDFNEDVFIFGAGFSKALNPKYPTLKELSEQIEKNYKMIAFAEHDGFDKPTSMVAKYYFTLPPKIRNNIEHLLTYLYAEFPWKTNTERNIDKALYYDILYRISYCFTYQTNEIKEEYLKLGEYINRTGSTCITFNYDLLLENLLQKTPSDFVAFSSEMNVNPINKQYYQIPMETFDAKDYLKLESNNFPKILKLHGSINWIYKANCDTNRILFNPSASNYALPSGYSPFIIPPVTDKTLFYKNSYISQIWQLAKNSLQNANNIYVIGYSFPETDLSANFLMNFGLQEENLNKVLSKKIYNINLKPNNQLSKFCKSTNVDIEEISCKECKIFKPNKNLPCIECENCKNMPMDKFIKNIITPKLKK